MGACLGKGGAAPALPRKGGAGNELAAGSPAHAASGQAARAAALGIPEDPEEAQVGCYLVFDSASGGVLVAQWSRTPVSGAWAFFFPRKPVAGFKFTQNGGKIEIIRGLAVNKLKVFNGWGQFIKLAFDMDGVLQIYSRDDAQAEFWYLNDKQEVNKIQHDDWFEAKLIAVVAIIPRHNASYKGVRQTPEEQFIDTAKGALGYTWRPLRR